ncbi:MAG: hemagglutinin repeat-containing protein [Pseudomonadota bacterium]
MFFPLRIYTLIKRFLAHFSLFCFLFEQSVLAQTLPITVDGSTATQVTSTASGIDQINIAAPNSSGLSHNKFNDYNVNSAGQIINNFSSNAANAVTATAIGGLVVANPNLNSGAASVILNEVTSGNSSQLLGYVEIAGSKADLIIANPNGITCSGCGFINTAHLSLIAGNSNFDAAGNLGFTLSNNPNLLLPLITIEGLGLDATRTSATDIIAASIKLISAIYGSNATSVTLKTGDENFDYNSKEITSSANNNLPLFAIDASSLAKIQSGNIFLIATKQGLGVNMESEILAGNNITIDVNGDVSYSTIKAGNSANIKSSKNISASASTSAPDLKITASGEFTNRGIISAYDLTIKDSTTFTNFGEVETLTLNFLDIENINNNSSIYAKNSLTIDGVNLTNSGLIYSPQNYTITLSGLLTNHAIITSGSDLDISAPNILNNSEISAKNNLTFLVAASTKNFGKISALGNLSITGTSEITNANQILSNLALSIAGSSLTNNSDSLIASLTTSLTLILTKNLQNDGELDSVTELIANVQDLTNVGDILSDNKLTILATNAVINSGTLQSIADFSATSESLDNSGLIKAFGKNTITSNSIINQSDALIFSSFDSTIISRTSFTNSGSLLSNGKLNLTLNSGTNNSEISSAGNLTMTLNNDFTNDGSLKSLENLDITTSNLTNYKKIISGGTFDLTASETITNNGSLKSADIFTIKASDFTNSASSLILSEKDLNISAAKIINQNTKPAASAVTTGIVAANGTILLQTDNLNNNSGLVIGKSTAVNALNAASVSLYNNLGAFISTAAISLNLGALDYTITGTVTADNIDITANNIINQGNVTASDYIKLNATGLSGVSDDGNITNGFASGDNSNIQLAAGTYIDFTAKNNINNYGTILGTTDTTLTSTSGNINNYSGGKITGGTGTTTINALNGAFNNTASTAIFTANNIAIFNSKNLNNYGEISVADNLTTNISNNLNNYATALIWSGNDAIFNVANNLTNNLAEIYVINNLTIQKNSSIDATQNKTASVQNISGKIATYAGDITIKSTILENKRFLSPIAYDNTIDFWFILEHGNNGRTYIQDSGYITLPYSLGVTNQDLIYHQTRAISENTDSKSSIITSAKNINFETTTLVNDMAEIYAENNINIATNSLSNSSLSKTFGFFVERCEIDSSFSCTMYQENQGIYDKSFLAYIKSGNSLSIVRNNIDATADFIKNDHNIQKNINISDTSYKLRSTIINNINTYNLSQTGIIKVDLSAIINAINDSGTIESGSISNISSGATTPSSPNNIFSGNFKINLDPSATTPLVEGRSQFTDISKFFGSTYYFDQLGLVSTTVLAEIDRQNRNASATRILGDAFVETTLILNQIRTLTNDSLYLSQSTTDANAQIKELLDNSVNQFATLGLNAEDVAINGLTTAQANSLTKDIITFEITTINGINVLAPKIYLSQDTRNRLLNSNSQTGATSLATNSTIFGKNSLLIDSPNANLFNSGSIASAGDLTLNLASFTNKTYTSQAQIIAGNNLNITAQSGDIKNLGSNIGAIGTINLTALQGNIFNSAIIQTNDANLLNSNADSYQLAFNDAARTSGNISSTLLQNAAIKGGAISINAANDFTNLAATISTLSSSGDLNITAGNDINIATLELRNRTETSWGNKKKGGTSISDITTNIGSDISSAANITLTSNDSDINIIGSNITAVQDLSLSSQSNINILNDVDSSLKESYSHKKGASRQSKSTAIDYVESALASNLSANNIIISSLGDTTIQGSNLNSDNNLIIGSFTIAQNSDGTYQKDSNGNYITTSGTSVDNLTIKNADLKEYHYAQTTRGYSGIAAGAMRIAPYAMISLVIVSDLAKKELAMLLPDSLEKLYMNYHPLGLALKQVDQVNNEIGNIKIKSETTSSTNKSSAFSSNLNVGGSMMINSVGDSLIQGSNLNITENLLANSLGNFTITAAQNTSESSSSTSYETAGKFHSDLNFFRVKYKAGTEKEFTKNGITTSDSILTQSNINVAGNSLINSSDEFALIASNFITNGSTEIIAANNLNILDGKNTESTSSYEDKLKIDTGIQIGNAYADAVYAVVDALEAQKKIKDAYDKLNKIENLYKEDQASSKAVERAKYQLVLAYINAGLSAAAAMQAVANAGQAAATSEGTGFYGSVYADITKSKSTSSLEFSQSLASNLISGTDLSLISGTKDINITGSNISSETGNLNLSAMLGNLNIKAGESTYSQSSKFKSQNLGGSFGNNGISINLGFNEAESSLDQTTFSNSQISANNGTLNINTNLDANIIGANLVAKDVVMNIGGNLLLKSKQNLLESDSYNIGLNIGGSGSGPSGTGASFGINLGDSYQSRAWVDNVTSIIGSNSVTINTTNNTNIIGAIIANQDATGNDLANLTINTNSLTFSDLKNYNNSESNNFGIDLQLGKNPNNPIMPGSLALNLNMQGNEATSNSKATIGKGNINIANSTATDFQLSNLNRDITNIETNKRDLITSDFNASLKIDLRILAAAGNLIIGDKDAAAGNWDSYVTDIIKGVQLTSDVAFGTNYSQYNPRQSKEGDNLSSEDAIVGTLPWLSRKINESNDRVDNGEPIIAPAPNLWVGKGGIPNTGINIQDPANAECAASTSCKILLSDQGALEITHDYIPGMRSASSFHDAGQYPSWANFLTIPPYFVVNYLGTVGTMFDVPNWNQNFLNPNTNIFKGTFINQPEQK